MVSNFQDSLGMGYSQRSVSVWKILKWVLEGTLEIATGLPNRLKLPGTKQGLLYLLLSPPILEPIWSSLQISYTAEFGTQHQIVRTEGIMLEIGKTKTIIPLSLERQIYITHKISVACYKIGISKEQDSRKLKK